MGIPRVESLIGVSPSGKARGFDPRMRRFESCHPSHIWDSSSVVEQLAFNQLVEGSKPSCPTI